MKSLLPNIKKGGDKIRNNKILNCYSLSKI